MNQFEGIRTERSIPKSATIVSETLLYEEYGIAEESLEERMAEVCKYYTDNIVGRVHELGVSDDLAESLKDESRTLENLELHVDGYEAYRRIIENIKSAKSSIYINIFLWRDDGVGNEIADAVLKAADRGVRVVVVKDRAGALFEHAEFGKESMFNKKLRPGEREKAGIIDAFYETPSETKSHRQIDNPLAERIFHHPMITLKTEGRRNDHSKYYIFDDETVITGGMNIGDEYIEWHDYMVECKSPRIVRRLKARLAGEMELSASSQIDFSLNRREGIVKDFEVKENVLELLDNASNEIIIEMAYLGAVNVTNSIIDAAKRGVQVRIILPENANVQDDLNKRTIQQILDKTDGNVSVYFYPGMVHAKLIHVDGRETFLGSANLNRHALERMQEMDIVIRNGDCDFTKELRHTLEEDMAKSKSYPSPPRIAFNEIKAFFEGSI